MPDQTDTNTNSYLYWLQRGYPFGDPNRVEGPNEAKAHQAVNDYKNNPAYAGTIWLGGGRDAQLQEAIRQAQVLDERNAAVQNIAGNINSSSSGGPLPGVATGGGNTQVATPINAGGFGGFFGQKSDYPVFVPGMYGDTSYAGNRAGVNDQIAKINSQNPFSSDGVSIDQQQQAAFRNRQMQLSDALMAQANGQGPSVAGSQLQQSTEQNLQAALAQAASTRGGNLGAVQYQLGNARANIQQQAAQQLAQTRIQEQMAARAQLGDVLNSGRSGDINLATNQAQLGQQNNQFNASLGADQRNTQNAMAAQLMAMGYSLDQANYLSTVQQGQFANTSLAQQIGASQGVSVQNAGQGIQLGGALIGAAGSLAAGGAGGLAAYTASKLK
jgi:hypothetical protein